jgi:hypothetical protein
VDSVTEQTCAARACERPPVLGLLCGGHGQRLADHYGAREGHGGPDRTSHGLPWMWDHLALAYPSLTGWAAPSRGGSDVGDPEAEKLAAVVTLRTEIRDHLVATALDVADRLGRRGPALATTERLQAHRSAGWLLAHIEPIRAGQGIADAADEAVAAVLDEADQLASRAHALAPWRPAPTRIDGIPCRCGAVGTVHDHGDVRKCWRCGREFDEHEWAALMTVLARRFRDHEVSP